MSAKWRYIFGTTTIVLIVGGTIYAIKKSKDAEKEAEQAISLEEARDIVESRKEEKEDSEEIHFTRKIEIVEESDDLIGQPYVSKIQGLKPSEIYYDEELDVEYEISNDDEDPLNDKYEYLTEATPGPTIEPLIDFSYIEDGIDPKEDKTLRFEPSSIEAKNQFIRMELADWEPNHDVYQIMLQLFDFAFIPTNDGDEIMRTQIIDYKSRFFGLGSKWNREVSYADVVLHYARSAEFDCGETVQYWVEYFLDFNEFTWGTTSQQVDTLLMRLNSHSYFNQERQTFGLFGLTRESMDQAIRIANGNIDRSVTYDIEFNEFLKSCL